MGTAPVETARALEKPYGDPGLTITGARGRVRASVGWLCVGIVFAIVLELACRVEDWVMYRTPLLSRYTAINDLVIRDADPELLQDANSGNQPAVPPLRPQSSHSGGSAKFQIIGVRPAGGKR